MKKMTLISLFAMGFSLSSFACSCEEMLGNAKKFLKASRSVFIGIPLSDSVATGNISEYGVAEVKTTLKVLKNFKAANQSKITVYSEKGDGANCGTYFTAKEGAVLVFTYMENRKLTTDYCSIAGIDYSKYSAEILLELL